MGRKKGRTMVEVGADGVAVITIINPPVNSLSLDGNSSWILFVFVNDPFLVCGF